MSIQTKEIKYAKELDDVGALLVGIVKAAKDKKPITEIAAAELKDLMDAVAGFDQIGQEFKDDKLACKQTLGLRLAEIEDVLLG